MKLIHNVCLGQSSHQNYKLEVVMQTSDKGNECETSTKKSGSK